MTEQDLTKYYEILELDSDASEQEITRAYQYLKNLYSKTSMATAPVDDEWDESDKQEILKQVEEAYVTLLPHAPDEEAFEEEPVAIPEVEEYEAAEGVEEPVVSIEFDEEETPKEDMEKKAELFDSYVEEEVLFVDLEEEKEEEKGEEEPEAEKGVEEDDTLAEKFVGGVDAKEITGAVLKEIRESQEWSLQDMTDSTQIPIDMLEHIEAEEFDKIPDAGYLRWYVTTYAKTLSLPNPKEVADQYMKLYRQWLKGQ